MTRRLALAALLVGTALSLAVSAAIAAGRLTVGSAEGGWVYPYVQPFHASMLLPAACACAAAALLSRVHGRRLRPAHRALLLVAWIAAATAFQALLRPAAPFSYAAILTSPGAHGFYSVAERHAPADVLRHFQRVRAQAPLHAQSNMPGKILLVHALKRVSSDPSALAWLLVVLSNCGAVFMYWFVRDFLDDPDAALIAAVLYLFVPARNEFLPLMNTVTPVVALALAWIVMRWLRGGRLAYAVPIGAMLYLLILFEPLPLVLGLLFAALAVHAVARQVMSWAALAAHASVALLTLVMVSEIVHWATGFEVVSTFRRIGAHAVAFNAEAGRPYAVWLPANLWEFVLAMGACQAVLCVAAIVWALTAGATWRERLMHPAAVVPLGLAAVLLTTDAIGINRGEVSRLWIFLACVFQAPAASACAAAGGRLPLFIVVTLGALQTALGVGRIGFVIP